MARYRFAMALAQARDVADEVGAPEARLRLARRVLLESGRRGMTGVLNSEALAKIEAEMALRGLPLDEPVAEAA